MQRLSDLLAPVITQLKANKSVSSNPMAMGMIDVLESGDSSRGEQLANNICESMGVSCDEALRQAKAFFNIP